jgi:hypothetical protein
VQDGRRCQRVTEEFDEKKRSKNYYELYMRLHVHVHVHA